MLLAVGFWMLASQSALGGRGDPPSALQALRGAAGWLYFLSAALAGASVSVPKLHLDLLLCLRLGRHFCLACFPVVFRLPSCLGRGSPRLCMEAGFHPSGCPSLLLLGQAVSTCPSSWVATCVGSPPSPITWPCLCCRLGECLVSLSSPGLSSYHGGDWGKRWGLFYFKNIYMYIKEFGYH